MWKDVNDDYDESIQRQEKRESRQERKQLRSKDRSKYKKTDQKPPVESIELQPGEIRGRILSIRGETLTAACDDRLLTCTLRGALKNERNRIKNLITVGDFVHIIETGPNEGQVVAVEPRKTTLSRADNLSRQKEHFIAANIDLVLITVSVVTPLLKTAIIDRYIIAAKKGGLDFVVVVNKIDMLEQDSIEAEIQKELYEDANKSYKIAGVPFVGVSTITGEGLDQLKEYMHKKASVFSGQSGVGKSSLINAITGHNLPTRHAVERTQKGAHTTTMAQLLPLPTGGWVIDTPGIRSFGIWDLQEDEVSSYFEEFAPYAAKCRFSNCSHTHEENCAVIKAVEKGKIHPLRYDSYCAILEDLKREHLRR